jgi:hypothetical protein
MATEYSSVADPDPGSGMGGKSAGSGIRDEQPGSYFLELKNNFLELKYLNSLMLIRDPGWKKVGSGIRDKHPGSATLEASLTRRLNLAADLCDFGL